MKEFSKSNVKAKSTLLTNSKQISFTALSGLTYSILRGDVSVLNNQLDSKTKLQVVLCMTPGILNITAALAVQYKNNTEQMEKKKICCLI